MINRNKKGFTLVELLVVIAIIGLLSTLAVIALASAREKARDSKRLSDIRQVRAALELYFAEHSEYPAGEGVVIGSPNAICLNSAGFTSAGCSEPFLEPLPKDPKQSQGYIYTSVSEQSSYVVESILEGEVDSLLGEIQATPSGITSKQ